MNPPWGGYDLASPPKILLPGYIGNLKTWVCLTTPPYDDYMLVLDEENGIGWWSTMRNDLPDMTTIYVFCKE